MAHRVVVGDRGRVVLPSEVRSALGLTPGTPLVLSTEPDGSLRLRPYGVIADEARGMFADLVPPGVSVVDELIAQRRREAARE